MSLVFGTSGISKKRHGDTQKRCVSKLFGDLAVWMLSFNSAPKCKDEDNETISEWINDKSAKSK